MPLPSQVDAADEPEQKRCSDERLGEVRENEPRRAAQARPATEVEGHLGGGRSGDDDGPPAPAYQDERRERHARRREEGGTLAGGAEPLPREDIPNRIGGCDDDEKRHVAGRTGLPRIEPRLPRRGGQAARSPVRRSERRPREHATPRPRLLDAADAPAAGGAAPRRVRHASSAAARVGYVGRMASSPVISKMRTVGAPGSTTRSSPSASPTRR